MYRAVCPACGRAVNIPNDGPCPHCGSQITLPRGGLLKIYRMGNFIGVAAACSIYLNNTPYGHIGNKETVQIPLPYGSYLVHMAQGLSRKCNDPTVTLSPQDPVACLKMHIRVGAFVNSMILEPADPASMPE